MKKITLLVLALSVLTTAGFATESKYESAMKDNISKVYSAENLDEFQQVINTFDRIAQNETDKWEPLYYAAFGYIMMSNNSKENVTRDRYLDLALEKVKSGLQLVPQEDELIALEGFIHMMRLSIDPATRGQQYAGLSMQQLNKAVALDPKNPRALYLLAQMEMGTARFFGNDTSAACEKLQKSIDLFSEQNDENPLAPKWGEGSAKSAYQQCQTSESSN